PSAPFPLRRQSAGGAPAGSCWELCRRWRQSSEQESRRHAAPPFPSVRFVLRMTAPLVGVSVCFARGVRRDSL
ncbi:MAG: hypothetical protein FWG71_10265, partial [Synergistaceae bacterium]|nr:hypothetical protein [Synergistaceae bacterium]